MSDELAVTYEVDSSEITLNRGIIVRYLTGGRNDVPEPEIAKFMMLCQARKLNPFTGDCYLSVYDTRDGVKTAIITSKDAFMRRAFKHPAYKGHEAGIVVMSPDGQKLTKRTGSLQLQGERLVGGWAKVHVDGFAVPIEEQVTLAEYDTMRALWKTHKATMIRKVALVHALREAFPDDLSGLYTPEEMGEKAEVTNEHQQG